MKEEVTASCPSPQSWTRSSPFCPQKPSETSRGWERGKHQAKPPSSPWDGSVGTCIMVSLMGNCRIRTSGFKYHRSHLPVEQSIAWQCNNALRHSYGSACGREGVWGMEHWLRLLNVHFFGYVASCVKFHSRGFFFSLVFQWLDSQKYHRDLI